jgi:mannose-6-phosphate isomerase-like protein (cupin superfamily)
MSDLNYDLRISPAFVRNAQIVEKLWGYEAILENSSRYCAKILMLNPGFQSSLHYHEYKIETFLILKGFVNLEISDHEFSVAHPEMKTRNRIMKAGDKITLYPRYYHRFWSASPSDEAWILEISTHDDPSDSHRLEVSREMPRQHAVAP